jgi:uncharacterized protein
MSAEHARRQSQAETLPRFQRAQFAFTAHVRAPEQMPRPDDVEDRRMAIYRELFFNNAESFVSNCFPVLRSLCADATWHALVRDFYARHVSHSPLFSEIPAEFLSYLEQEKPTALAPHFPFVLELAHYEWLELVAQIAMDELPAAHATPVTADTEIVLSPLAFVQAYQFPVQHIGTEFQPAEAPTEPTLLVVYRNRADVVQFLALNPLSYQLLTALEPGAQTAGRLLLALAETLALPSDRVVAGGLAALQDFVQRDIVLALP